jgi:hypothetical protein
MVIVSVLFGIGHVYQGVAGVIGSAVSGLSITILMALLFYGSFAWARP